MRDARNENYYASTLTPAVRTADASGAGVDRTTNGANAITHLAHIGIGGITFDSTNKLEIVMEESDDDNTYTAVAQKDCIVDNGVTVTSGIVKAFTAAHAAAAVYAFGYRGNKRYSRLKLDFSGTHGTGTPTSLAAIHSHNLIAPAA